MYELYPFQKTGVETCLEYLTDTSKYDGGPSLAVFPTGSGKSLIIAEIVNRFKEPVLVLVPAKELLKQNYRKFKDFGGTATLYSNSVNSKVVSERTFGTIQSILGAIPELIRLGVKNIIIDEAHYKFPTNAKSLFMKLIKALEPRKVLGLTATPFSLVNSQEGSKIVMLTRKQGAYFKRVICNVQIQEIYEKYWSKLTYQVSSFDGKLLSYNTSGSGYTDDSVAKALAQNGTNKNIVLYVREQLKKGRKKVLIFCDSVATAKKMTEYIPDCGFICSDTKPKERDKVLADFASGKLKCVANVGILTTGFDEPQIDLVVLGRPVSSMSLYYQMIGRGVRKHIDKLDCIIADFCGNYARFGRVEDFVLEDNIYDGEGYYSRDRLLTGIPMAGQTITREYLAKRKRGAVETMPFGKYKGKPLMEVPRHYFEFLLNPTKFKGRLQPDLKRTLLQILG